MPNLTKDADLRLLSGDPNALLALVRQCFNAHFVQETVQQKNRLCWRFENFAFKFIFPPMLIFSVLGNILTILVYRSRFLKGAATVNLLTLKAAANFLGVCSLCLEMTRHLMIPNDPKFGDDLLEVEGPLSNVTEKIFDEKAKYQISNFEEIYWDWKPYMLFLTNFFGTLAVW
uniref:Uncharacterized protein n=1 Tax=Romanomermis culicivorax TaxID=13658 RepID=A0A915IPM5_ROMCU